MVYERGYAGSIELACAQCGPVTVAVPLIVDLEDTATTPDLLEAIRQGTIHKAACPGCGSTLTPDAPLLVCCPGPPSLLLFSPAQETTAEQDHAAARALSETWQRQRQPPGSDKPPAVVPFPRELLPGLLSSGGLSELQRRLHAGTLHDPPEPRDALLEVVDRFVDTILAEDAYFVVREHPELLKLSGEESERLHATIRQRMLLLKQHAAAAALDGEFALLRRCQEAGLEGAFAELLGCSREELQAIVAASPLLAPSIMEESADAEQLYLRNGDVSALDRVTTQWERVLFGAQPDAGGDGRPIGHVKAHKRQGALDSAARLFLHRHSARGAMADLNRALTIWTRLVGGLPEGSPERLRYMSNLGMAYRTLYDNTAEPEALERAVALSYQALDATPPGSPDRAAFLVNLGICIRKRYERTGLAEDLENAISLSRQSLDVAPPGSRDRARACIGMGNCLMIRHQRAGRMEDPEEAIALYREALHATPAGSSDWPGILSSLAQALRVRYKHAGRLEDLHEATALYRQAAGAVSPGSPSFWRDIQELSDGLLLRYGRTGRIEDLEEAIALHRQAVDIAAPGSPDWASLLRGLGNGLSTRHKRLGRMEDLEEAIAVFRRALDAVPPNSHDRAGYLNNLATCLRTRSDVTGRIEDLEEAITLFRQARAAAIPSDSPDRWMILNNLAAALRKRHEHTQQMEDLQESIALFRYNLDAAPPGGRGQSMLLVNIGNCLRTRYKRTRQMQDLEEAIAVYRQALTQLPEGSPDRPTYLRGLGVCLGERYESTERIEDLTEANEVHREATRLQGDLDAAVGMDRRTIESAEVTCPQCGPITVEIRLIVDLAAASQEPEVVDAIRGGTLHQVACSTCGSVLGVFDAPLLLYCPFPQPTLVFAPARGATAEQREEMARALVQRWLTLADESAISANPSVIWMPWELLAVVVDEGVDAARARLAEALAQPVAPVEAALVQLLRAGTVEELYGVIRGSPELAGERADALLAAERDRALEAGNEKDARVIEYRAGLLHRCREIGVQATFAETFSCTSEALRELDALASVPRSVQEGIREAEQHEARYHHGDDMRALSAACACWERVLSDPGFHLVPLSRKAWAWSQAGDLFLRRHHAHGEVPDLDRAVAVWGQALEALPPDSPLRPIFLSNMGTGLKARYEVTARFSDLEEAIGLSRRALDESSPDSPNWQGFLGSLSDGILKRYEHTGQMDDLEEAIVFGRRAVDVSSTDPGAINALAAALIRRYDRTGRLEDVEEIIAISSQARDRDAPDRPACLDSLGVGLIKRYQRTGMMKDLEEAIAAFKQNLDVSPAASQGWLSSLTSLGTSVGNRYERTGRMEDLQEAIALLRRAVDARPSEPITLSSLSGVLLKRYTRAGRMEDLQEGITLLRRAVNASAPGSLEHPAWLNNLGIALHDRYLRTHQIGDLEESIALCRQAAEATPPGSPDEPLHLGNVGLGLNERYSRTGSVDDLQEAIAVLRRALDSASIGDPERRNVLSHMATSFSFQYERTKSIEDLEEAISVYRQAVNATSPEDTRWPMACYKLSSSLYRRYEHTGRSEDLEEAIALSRRASELGRALDPHLAVHSAGARGRWLLERSRWEDAADAYREAMTIVDALCEAQVRSSDKHSWLRLASSLYAEAAYCMARLGDLKGAALAMETGRARVLTEMLDRTRADLEQIEEQAPELVHRYRQMLVELRHLEGITASGAAAQAPGAAEHDRRLPERIREAHAELHASVEAIRATPGGESFLAWPSVDTLRAALTPGVPVIYLAATPVGGLALVVSAADGDLAVTPLWLDSLTTDAVYRILQGSRGTLTPESWLGAYSNWKQRPGDREARTQWHDRITQTTRALWDMAVEPVVALLRERFAGSEQAVLIPNGHLALLPLHAAWTDEGGGRPRWALDEAAFCYAPSMRALAHARDTAGSCGPIKQRLLVVDEPRPTSASPLPNSRHEVDTAAAKFAPDDVTRLSGEQCRREDVLSAIAVAHICHFACHGGNDWQNPLRSGLLMANDETLAVEDLFALPGRQARMAVLSACETGIVGTDAPNEVVALPSAFLQAGFAGVVASLWSVYDISASLLMARFYELWREDGLSPAVALRRAQLWLRDLTNRELVAHLERLVPELAARMSAETAEALHFHALVRDPDARSFAAPVHWAAFYLTGV